MELTAISAQSFLSSPLVVTDDASNDASIEVLQGLLKKQKTLPSKLFYDQRGSLLFDQICKSEEYYPTRTETAIMQHNIHEIAGEVGSNCMLIEYGSGSSVKTRLMLDHLPEMAAYVPVDISREHLFNAVENLDRNYPNLVISPLWADFTKAFSLPLINNGLSQKLAYFPGSTIGNFYHQQAIDFMRSVAALVGSGGGFLIGIDLQKDPDILNLAYNDHQGITAAFNLNILTHINRKFHADFMESQFEHLAFYNQQSKRIEMHLISKVDQVVTIHGSRIGFQQGESILTEVSYKYTIESFARMADQAGFNMRKAWVDSNSYFSIQYLVAN